MIERRSRPLARWVVAVTAVLLATFLSGGLSGGASAQDAITDESMAFGVRLFKGKANCIFCHGWRADGIVSNRSGGGANLRETALDREGLVEVIACGRPGTTMPHHDRRAYTDDRCYGMTAADLGQDKPKRATRPLAAREINAIVDLILGKVKDMPVTLQYCEFFWPEGSSACNPYREQG